MVYFQGQWYRNVDTDARHTCFAVAGAICGETRIRVLEAMRGVHQHVVAVHTDGILVTRKPELDEGEDMGQWGFEGKWDTAYIIGTGTGVFRKGSKYKAKMRGIHASLADMKRVLRSGDSIVTVDVRHARTLADARRTKYSSLNEMLVLGRNVNANMDRKRIWPRDWDSFREMAGKSQRSESILIVEKRALDLWKGESPCRRRKRKTTRRRDRRTA